MGLFFSKADQFGTVGLYKPEDVFSHFGDKYYGESVKYWSNVESNDDGMLDGFLDENTPDLDFTKAKIEYYLKNKNMGKNVCVDVGAGIGRISLHVFSKYFKEIHLVEPVKKFTDVAVKELSKTVKVKAFNMCAQDLVLDDDVLYDCIWIQWTLMYLTDDDCVKLLINCKKHLAKNGFIFVKENMLIDEETQEYAQWAPHDHSLCRSKYLVKKIIEKTGLKIIEEENQPNWKKELIPLYLFVLE